jgi:hypothetical protein
VRRWQPGRRRACDGVSALQGGGAPRRRDDRRGRGQGLHAAVRRVPPGVREARARGAPARRGRLALVGTRGHVGTRDARQISQGALPLTRASSARSGALPRYCIGDVALATGEAPLVSYDDDLSEGQFYATLKTRVEAHFRNSGRPWEKARTLVRMPLCALRGVR